MGCGVQKLCTPVPPDIIRLFNLFCFVLEIEIFRFNELKSLEKVNFSFSIKQSRFFFNSGKGSLEKFSRIHARSLTESMQGGYIEEDTWKEVPCSANWCN